ncbi:MAG: DCC1-like thiol-disulfide oxidoreductase family protein [Stappiaceae bacterium]
MIVSTSVLRADPVLLYDGVCVLCSRAVSYTLAHERTHTIRFVAIQSAEGGNLANQYGINPHNPDSFLFIEDRTALRKSDGVLALMQHLNGPARLFLWAKYLPRSLRDWCYDRLARNRYCLFGRKQACTVPDNTSRHRFILPNTDE